MHRHTVNTRTWTHGHTGNTLDLMHRHTVNTRTWTQVTRLTSYTDTRSTRAHGHMDTQVTGLISYTDTRSTRAHGHTGNTVTRTHRQQECAHTLTHGQHAHTHTGNTGYTCTPWNNRSIHEAVHKSARSHASSRHATHATRTRLKVAKHPRAPKTRAARNFVHSRRIQHSVCKPRRRLSWWHRSTHTADLAG